MKPQPLVDAFVLLVRSFLRRRPDGRIRRVSPAQNEADRSEMTYARAQRLKLLTELDVTLITKNLPVR